MIWSISTNFKLPLLSRLSQFDIEQFSTYQVSTLFSKRSAHWLHPVLPVTLGYWPWSQVMPSLSNGLGSNMQKTPFENWYKLWHRVSSASYSQDHLTKSKWPEVRVSYQGTSGNQDDFQVQNIRRKVYSAQNQSQKTRVTCLWQCYKKCFQSLTAWKSINTAVHPHVSIIYFNDHAHSVFSFLSNTLPYLDVKLSVSQASIGCSIYASN